MSDITKDLPAWTIPAVLGGVVLLALLQSKSGGTSGGNVGAMTMLAPTPADPGILALEATNTNARAGVISRLIDSMGSQAISTTSAGRDVAISGINASVANQRTAASEAVGIAQTDSQTAIGIANAKSAADINSTKVAGTTSVAHIAAKTQTGNQIVDVIKSVGGAVLKIFGF